MALDLGDSDRTAEIMPDGGREIYEGICHILEGFGIRLTTTVEEEHIHDISKEMNQ